MTDTADLAPSLQADIAELYRTRDRAHMAPTIAAFAALLEQDPENPVLLYELAGAYDTDGQEDRAAALYERALDAGLSGDALRRLAVQYGSTLRNLGRTADSDAVLRRGLEARPDSDALRAFAALTSHAAGRSDVAVGELLLLVADLSARTGDSDLGRYTAAVRGNAAYLLDRDGH